VRQAGLTEVSRTDVEVRLKYTWPELAHKYGRPGQIAPIINFFEGSADSVKSLFSMRIDAQEIHYSSQFRVSVFRATN